MEQIRIKVPSKGKTIEIAPGVTFVERNHTFGPVFFLEATSEVTARPDVIDGETCTRYEWTSRLLDVKQIPHPGREEKVDEGYRNRIGENIFYSLTDSGLGCLYAPTLFQSFEESERFWEFVNARHKKYGR